jgi:peptidoglycan/xylan/chitin deacetylase (PgdA/CDA1 family)
VRRRRAVAGVALLAIAPLAVLLSGSSHQRSSTPPAAAALGAAHHGAASVGARTTAAREARAATALRPLIALGKPIYCAAPRGNEVALTFDDGPGVYTRLVLAKLRKHGVRATFFVVGRNIPLLPGALREERALGAVGDHTFTHPLLTALPQSEAEQEIASTQAAVASASGAPVLLFRPPYGGRNAAIDAIARAHGMLEIMWTVDSADSLGANYAQIEHNVIGGLRGGSIILMHENHGQTVRALLGIFAALQRKHLRTVSVPQLLADDPPSLAQVRAGGSACGVSAGRLGGS